MRNPPPLGEGFSGRPFSVAMEHSPVGTALVSLEGAWLWANAALRQLRGYSQAESSRLTFNDVTHPDDFGTDMSLMARLFAGERSSCSMEKRYVRKDGGAVPVWLTVALVRDDTSAPLYFIVHVQDNTAKLAAAAERALLMARMSRANRTAGVGIWEWEFATNAVSWDAVMFDLYGAAPSDDVKLATFEAYVHPEDRARVVEELSAAAAGALFDTHFRINRRDGEVRYIRAFATLLRNGPADLGRLIGTNWDVTDARRLQEDMLAASRAKPDFLAMISHEIRTPLNGVLGMAQAMAADPLPDGQRTRLDIIRQSGESLLTILNDVLDFSKIEAGKLVLEDVEFDLDELVQGVQATFEALARQKDLTFDVDIGEAHGVYRGDPTRIRQILCNLVSNAVKFTDRGRVGVTIGRRARGLQIQVRDTGIGIAPEHRATLFNRFEQAGASITRRFGGTGLGLAICHDLTIMMGGAIDVESQPDQGTVFTLTVPLVRVGEARAREIVRSQTPVARQSPDLRVLAAEDNASNRLVLATLLGQVGVAPVIVENGAEAVEAWSSGNWDVILMDLQMPVMDGLTATTSIRSQEATIGRARTPIIALTANAMSHQVVEYLAAGMDGHVAKPIDARALFAALETVLGDTEARETRAA